MTPPPTQMKFWAVLLKSSPSFWKYFLITVLAEDSCSKGPIGFLLGKTVTIKRHEYVQERGPGPRRFWKVALPVNKHKATQKKGLRKGHGKNKRFESSCVFTSTPAETIL